MLVRDRKLGAALARKLGKAPFALMRGHGSVAVGATLKQVVFRSIYAEVNARLQSEALRLGTITYLNDAEAANAARTNDSVIDRPWGLWKARIKSRG
jgi:HCOMODA/2-hydroxy-3-carboxy-muconic semialdehyde decarboxylase